jgi:hypothetical protein
MRESQMKKIIAAAVATAFVAPAFAADVTLSGSQEFSLVSNQTTTATTDTAATDTAFTIKASTETANGLSISTDINMDADGSHDGGNSINISGPMGSIVLGDDSGALDSIDGKTDPFLVVDHDAKGTTTSQQNFSDAAVTWTLPTLAEGLTVKAAYSPSGGDAGVNSTAEGTSADQSGVVVSYAMGPVFVGYASQDVGTDKDQGGVITYTFEGLTLAYESFQNKTAAGAKSNYKAIGAQYSMGDMTFAWASTEEDTDDSNISEGTAYGVHYNLGGGVNVFAESSKEDVESGLEEETAIGIRVAF